MNKVREFLEGGELPLKEKLAKLQENKDELLRAGAALRNYLLLQKRLAKLREGYVRKVRNG